MANVTLHNYAKQDISLVHQENVRNTRRFIILFSYLGIGTLFLFGNINLYEGARLTGIIELLATAMLVLNLVSFLITNNRVLASVVMVFMVGIPLIALLFLGGIQDTGILWFAAYPLIAFYLFNRKWGVFFVMLLFLVTFGITMGQVMDFWKSAFSNTILFQLLINFFVVSYISYLYASARQHQDEQIDQNISQLNYQTLILGKKNQELEDSKDALETAKAKDEAILSSIGEGVIVIGVDNSLLFMNAAAKSILGFSAGIGQSADWLRKYKIINPETKKVFTPEEDPIQRALQGERITSVDGIVPNPTTGKNVYITATVCPVQTHTKRRIGIVITFRDMSREKEIDKAKTEFVSLASHQMRTPLSAVSWYTEMLLDGDAGKITAKQKQYLKEVYFMNRRMVELIDTFLSVSRLELGKLVADNKPVKVTEVAEYIIAEEKKAIQEKEILVEMHFDDTIGMITTDRKLLSIVFQNLLSNAVKYTPAHGRIDFSIQKEGSKLMVKVADTGMGIPEAQQAHIFKKMFRADNARAQDSEGTGLGLYIVKSIVELLKGEICFTSKEGVGTTFQITFPIV
jgi:signal transduction histidine kinase